MLKMVPAKIRIFIKIIKKNWYEVFKIENIPDECFYVELWFNDDGRKFYILFR